jgi:transcriptional regulator with XRE-family HTH domain
MDATTLRAWRTHRNLSRREAAAMLGVRVRTLEGLENDPQSDSVLWEPIGIIVELRNEIDRLTAASSTEPTSAIG